MPRWLRKRVEYLRWRRIHRAAWNSKSPEIREGYRAFVRSQQAKGFDYSWKAWK